MSISTFNFQFYNYKMPAVSSTILNELDMDIDEIEDAPAITSTPLPSTKQAPALTRLTSELALAISAPETPTGIVAACRPEARATPVQLQPLRPQLHTAQKRWSMELREKVLEMSKRNNGADVNDQQTAAPAKALQNCFMQNLTQEIKLQTPAVNSASDLNATFTADAANDDDDAASVSDKINFFNKLTTTYECITKQTQNNNKFISLLRCSRPLATATSSTNAQVPPPKPKRLSAALPLITTPAVALQMPLQQNFATPSAKPPTSVQQRKSSLRRKPSMEKSRATIARQNSNVTLRPQRHTMMEDLSLVVPVRLRIAEYEQRISMCG